MLPSIWINFSLPFSSLIDNLKSFSLRRRALQPSLLSALALDRASASSLYLRSISARENSPDVTLAFFLNSLIRLLISWSPSSSFSLPSTSMENCSSLSTMARGSGRGALSRGSGLRLRLFFMSSLLPTLVNCDWNISDSVSVFSEIGCRLRMSLFFSFWPLSSFSMMVSSFSLNLSRVSISASCWLLISCSSATSLQYLSASSCRYSFSLTSSSIIYYSPEVCHYNNHGREQPEQDGGERAVPGGGREQAEVLRQDPGGQGVRRHRGVQGGTAPALLRGGHLQGQEVQGTA